MEDHCQFVGAGWHPLVRVLDDAAARLNYEVLQVKEKFGGLRYYARVPEKLEERSYVQMNNLVEACELLSFHMCEDCGAPAVQTSIGGWIKTLCPIHTKEKNEAYTSRKGSA